MQKEVTGTELDLMVDLALSQDGTIGSRMTGAGFGGCTVSIVQNDKVKDFIRMQVFISIDRVH